MGPGEMGAMNASAMFLAGLASGTSANPAAWEMPMLEKTLGSWNTAYMLQAFIDDTQQTGPRGHDKLYAPNWFMFDAEHSAGEAGAFQFNLMVSLEPATVTDRSYPLLFQTGETAFGKPLVDAQHPHDLIMALGFEYARTVGEHGMLELFFAPVGDPALGPVAYPHRASALEIPQAPLSHHWQDSTHIADEVITAGFAYRKFRLEASGFYGSEPNENRWNIDSGPINSWSTRLWFFPSANWAAQISVGRLAKPEALEPGDQVRSTGSLAYSRPLAGSTWSSTFVWGRNHNTANRRNTNSYLAETVIPATRRNSITARAELVDKDELFASDPAIENALDQTHGSTFRIGAYVLGYVHDFTDAPIKVGIGANLELYTLPDAIKPYYGDRPVGGNVFVRFRLAQRR